MSFHTAKTFIGLAVTQSVGKHPVSTAATILWEDRWQRLIPKADLL